MRRRLMQLGMAIGLTLSACFLWRFVQTSRGEGLNEQTRHLGVLTLVLAVVCQGLAHVLRARKSQLLLNVIRPVGFWPLLRGLSLGFLWNSLLPFRLGELVRAHEVGRAMSVSRAAVLFTILLERAVDGFILSACVLALWGSQGFPPGPPFTLLGAIAGSVALASFLVAAASLVFYRQDTRVLRTLGSATRVFNERIRDRVRFVLWSIIHGMHRVLRGAPLFRYFALSLVMWAFYLASILLIVRDLAPLAARSMQLGTSLSSYLAVSIPSGPAYLGTYHFYFSSLARSFLGGGPSPVALSLLTWAVLMVPFTAVGAFFMLVERRRHPVLLETDAAHPFEALRNKLHRETDVSRELSQFLDAYFSGQELSRVLSTRELKGEFQLIRTFKGGSNAVTLLVWENGRLFVKKLTLSQHADKLRAQYQWLRSNRHLAALPQVSHETQGPDSYAFNIEYRENFVPFFDFMHSESLERSEGVLEGVLEFAYTNLYTGGKPVDRRDELERYLAEKVVGKVRDASALSDSLRALVEQPRLVVNGRPLENLSAALQRLQANAWAMRELSVYSESAIHGDLTVDNIIVSREDAAFLVLDPNNENAISSPMVDLAKLYQSLHSGYEFMCQLTQVRVEGDSVQFSENASSRYAELFRSLQGMLARRATEESRRTILFHEAVHFFRMLTYRARINPATLPAFYAVAVKLLNDFNAQYSVQTQETEPLVAIQA